MSASSHDQLWPLFHQALEQPADARMAFVREQAESVDQAERICQLLRAAEQPSPLDEPPIDRYATLLEDPTPDRIGPYRIVEHLGRGGMADVYRARQVEGSLKREVAIKLASSARYSPALLDQFRAEQQILSDLSHPNIARLFDAGLTEEGAPYLVMEIIDGTPMVAYCQAQALGVDARLSLFLQLCAAIRHAHQNLVLHRDIKPDNVLVDREGQVKLLDFGVAKMLHHGADSRMTQAFGQVLTPAYASPEQFTAQPLTTASDVYSLGVMLFELLTGQPPYQVDVQDLEQIIEVVCHQKVPWPSSCLNRHTTAPITSRQLKGDLDHIILRCLAKRPDQRYGSVSDLADDLERYRHGFPVSARGLSSRYQLGHFIRRHPVPVTAGLLAFVVLAILSLSLNRQADSLRTALAQADVETRRSEQISEFLVSLFDTADPTVSNPSERSLSSVVQEGVRRVQELSDQPELQIPLLRTLGRVQGNLNHYQSARELLDSAIALHEQRASDPPELALVARLDRARLDLQESRFDQATGEFETILAALGTASGAKTLAQDERISLEIQARIGLARALTRTGELSAALSQVHLSRALIDETTDATLAAEAEVTLGSILWSQGRYDQAATPYRLAFERLREALGPTHYRTLRAQSAHATLSLRNGNYTLAESLWMDLLPIAISALGEGHEFVADTRNKLGALYLEQGRLVDADQQLEQSLQALDALHGDRPAVNRAHVLTNLALVKRSLGQYQRSLALIRAASQSYREIFGDEGSWQTSMLNNEGLVLLEMQQFDAAMTAFSLACDRLRAASGSDHPNLAYCLNNQADIHLLQGRYNAAESLARQALDLRQRHLDQTSAPLATSLTTLGAAVTHLEQTEEAIALLQQAIAIRRDRLQTGDWRIGLSQHRLALALQQSGRTDQARTTLIDAARLILPHYGLEHWRSQALMEDARQLGVMLPEELMLPIALAPDQPPNGTEQGQ